MVIFVLALFAIALPFFVVHFPFHPGKGKD